MEGRPDLDRLVELNRECHRIFAQYDPDPDNAIYQHAKIKELMALDFGQARVDQDEEAGSISRET